MSTLDVVASSLTATLKLKPREGEAQPVKLTCQHTDVRLNQGQVNLCFEFDCVII